MTWELSVLTTLLSQFVCGGASQATPDAVATEVMVMRLAAATLASFASHRVQPQLRVGLWVVRLDGSGLA